MSRLDEAIEHLHEVLQDFHNGGKVDYEAYCYLWDEIAELQPSYLDDDAVTPPPAGGAE